MSAYAWLNSEDGLEWSLGRSRIPGDPAVTPLSMRRDGLVEPAEDPTGRPPVKGPALIAATEECG